MAWSSEQYLKFGDERTRPARDLLQAVPSVAVASAVDLGCGPGNSTELIAARYPEAALLGLDSSPKMIKAASERLPNAKFEVCAIEEWKALGPCDLIFANAALQWVGDHETVFPQLAASLSPGGSLAVQMPDNLGEPLHVAMREVAATPPFASKLGEAAKARAALASADGYYALLKPLCRSVDIWRTTYYHPLSGGVGAIVEWVKGTGLIPFLKPLSPDEQKAFLGSYQEELSNTYVPLDDGTVILPFPRLFIVATR